MNRIAKTLWIAAVASMAGAVSAQTPGSTDEAREQASRELARQQYLSSFAKPQLEPVALGDYFAEARNRTRVANYQAMAEAVLAYGAGARSEPIAVNSEDTARAEAARVRAERQIGGLHALLQSSPQARADLRDGLRATQQVASR